MSNITTTVSTLPLPLPEIVISRPPTAPVWDSAVLHPELASHASLFNGSMPLGRLSDRSIERIWDPAADAERGRKTVRRNAISFLQRATRRRENLQKFINLGREFKIPAGLKKRWRQHLDAARGYESERSASPGSDLGLSIKERQVAYLARVESGESEEFSPPGSPEGWRMGMDWRYGPMIGGWYSYLPGEEEYQTGARVEGQAKDWEEDLMFAEEMEMTSWGKW